LHDHLFQLRQLEEQRRGPAAAHADDCDVVRRAQHQHTKSLPSALQHVQLRGTLMDRLNLLESRIRQLSCELDLDDDYAGKAALGLGTSSAPVLEPCRDPGPPMMCMSSDKPGDESWSAVEILHKDARHKPNPSNKVSVGLHPADIFFGRIDLQYTKHSIFTSTVHQMKNCC
jgi:hypothetical protein